MKNILILGGSGMLGSMVTAVLAGHRDWTVTATARDPEAVRTFAARLPGAQWRPFDAAVDSPAALLAQAGEPGWIVNAIGITKPLVRDDNAGQVERAIRINALLPHALGVAAVETGWRVLQIATDCVYSGVRGAYRESDAHDALDVYGKTKSLGECHLANVHHLRCSIIGPEPKEFKFLLEWFLRQPPGGRVDGYTNHRWNGVTTLHFARLCAGIIGGQLDLPHVLHVVPAGEITKAALLGEFARHWNRGDIQIRETEAGTVVDRTLVTAHPEWNLRLWQAAGYTEPPTVPAMLAELAAFGRIAEA